MTEHTPNWPLPQAQGTSPLSAGFSQPPLGPGHPVHPSSGAFFERVTGLLDGQPKDEAVVSSALESVPGWDMVLDSMAAQLYHLATLLVGDGEPAVHIIELAIARTGIEVCQDHIQARHAARLALGAEAIAVLALRDPISLAAPEERADNKDQPVTCIDDDDLSAIGITPDQLRRIFSGQFFSGLSVAGQVPSGTDSTDRDRVRVWLEGLPSSLRAIFALRAIGGLSPTEVADLLRAHGGPAAFGWTRDQVREVFRQALCSLASQLIHATVNR